MKNGTKYRSSEVKNIQIFKSAQLTTRLRENQGLVSPCVFTEREDRNERMRSVWLSNELNADVDTYFFIYFSFEGGICSGQKSNALRYRNRAYFKSLLPVHRWTIDFRVSTFTIRCSAFSTANF